jgi:hypothetical protein
MPDLFKEAGFRSGYFFCHMTGVDSSDIWSGLKYFHNKSNKKDQRLLKFLAKLHSTNTQRSEPAYEKSITQMQTAGNRETKNKRHGIYWVLCLLLFLIKNSQWVEQPTWHYYAFRL